MVPLSAVRNETPMQVQRLALPMLAGLVLAAENADV
ncbi:hypothetical protein ABIF38_002259 [Bradyrhizobium japonicum]|jgi:hypothetical protein|uniref:Uncharacterized protein n=1 Tax=Bradyrhizobium elkanii TaxID=29448 RepID=A0A8I1Y6S0_BRAEL|nr:hypothetical protein [Bradyrhizobium elkanii]MCS4010030.1 hypothetical protein [Bradyrhizobium elkanii USDA 61]MBP2431228.1 hypothetical protein [Bradyrhizobium elkanii]MCP1735427.1 hypothetical protein [Bradyrhizobium elkanii]MCP1753227.1 hypothetical protein [Bradyrhizobium elkanii]